MQRIVVFGGDGFCGWPIALKLSASGHDVTIVDNFSRRDIAHSLRCDSLTPIQTMKKRIEQWRLLTGNKLYFKRVDIAANYHGLWDILKKLRPGVVVHLAEQRSAPFSMKGTEQKLYTVNNNIIATHNLLVALTDLGIDAHIVHIGSMGSYGYGGHGDFCIPEGYIESRLICDKTDKELAKKILFPADPGSVYHMTKVMDAQLFQFYNKNDGLRITDLYQGIVWGTQTAETKLHPDLINRFDYDGDYGTVLNRFIVQGIVGHPITVYGSGERMRAFIHIEDTAACVQIAIENPPESGERVRVINQTTEQLNLNGLAKLISKMTGGEIRYYTNPRIEEDKGTLTVTNDTLLNMGLHPKKLNEPDLIDVVQLVEQYKDEAKLDKILCTSTWRKDIAVDWEGKECESTD